MEAEENGANNELLYLSAWSIMRKAYKEGNIEYSVLKELNERVAKRLSVRVISLRDVRK